MSETAPTSINDNLRLMAIINELRSVWEGMPMSVAALFVKIAQYDQRHEPLTITEAGEMVGMKLASASRNIQLLESKMGERGQPPVALVEVRSHPSDYRKKVVSLTPKGRTLYGRLNSLAALSSSVRETALRN